jgi:hypothetical protein
VGGTCGKHGRGEKSVQGFSIDGRIGIRMDLGDIGWGSVEWILLAQDRGRWRVLVNMVMSLRVLAPRS